MANEVVKYHNDLEIRFLCGIGQVRKWTFSFAIIAKLRDVSTREVQFDKHGLTELSNYSRTITLLRKQWKILVKKISQIHYIERTSNSLELMNLFSRFRIDWSDDLSDMTASSKGHGRIRIICRKPSKCWGLPLMNLKNLLWFVLHTLKPSTVCWSNGVRLAREVYSWRLKAFVRYALHDYYGPSEIDKYVLKPVLRGVPQFFSGFENKKVKANTRGNPVKSYIFTWISEKSEKWIDGKYDKKPVGSGKAVRKEKLPEWAKEGYIQPKEQCFLKKNRMNWTND